MSIRKQLTVLIGVALLATVVSMVVHPKRPPWFRVESPEVLRWQIDTDKARSLIETGEVLLIDAREREKFEKGHLPSAILLNQQEWGDLMFTHMDRLQEAMRQTVIVYCDGTDCRKSREVARQLRELVGLDPVYVLKGDWRELRAE